MNVSIGVVAFNEGKVMDGILTDILNQTYSHEKLEIILVDSASTDNTKSILCEFKEKYKDEFRNIQVLDNPERLQSCGWNVVFKNFTSDVVIRVDAHAHIPKDFIEKNMKCIESGEMVCGGPTPSIVTDSTPWKETLLLCESSMFGSSIAPYRNSTGKKYVKSISHGAYRREVIEKVGMFNHLLGRTEDNEYHYRIRQAGYNICYENELVSYQHARATLKKMASQKFGNGYWIGLTSGVCPGCISLYHFVPLAFVGGIIFTTILALLGYSFLAKLMWILYWSLSIIMAVMSVRGKSFNKYNLLIPFIFFVFHFCYGIGTLKGILYMPFWRRKYKEKING